MPCVIQQWQYAGVQGGIYCFCGDDYDIYGESKDCTTACNGDITLTCGGALANDVYRTGYGMSLKMQ